LNKLTTLTNTPLDLTRRHKSSSLKSLLF
jgi:hypothetical protein